MWETEIRREMAENIIHGAVVSAGNAAGTYLEQAWGFATPSHRIPMQTDTVIDLASITKVLVTATALLQLRDGGQIDLDAPFTAYLPQYTAVLPHPITVRDLATHISGFGQQEHFRAPTGAEVRRKLLTTPPTGPYGHLEYSCWNFLLLAMIVENQSGQPLPEYCREHIFRPLDMNDTALGRPAAAVVPERLAQTCTTENPGQISDPPAFTLYRDGFSAGNAGAFSDAPDLAKFCRCLLRGGEYAPGKRLFSPAAFAEITTPQVNQGGICRSFGWIISSELKPGGFSAQTIYHSGWSGQTVFLDLEQQFFAIVLTTRTVEGYAQAAPGRFRIIGALGRQRRK